jgi:nicotinamide riboside kinase
VSFVIVDVGIIGGRSTGKTVFVSLLATLLQNIGFGLVIVRHLVAF